MNRWSQLASLMLILAAIGHFVIVDLSLIFLEADYVQQNPVSSLGQMRDATIDWGWMGNNKLLNIFSGFSLWVPVSCLAVALYNMAIFRHLPPGHQLRLHALIIGFVLSLVFLAIALICFIYPPIVGGILAALFFALAIKKEKELGKS